MMSECPEPWWASRVKIGRREMAHKVRCSGEMHNDVVPICGTYLSRPCREWEAVGGRVRRCAKCLKKEAQDNVDDAGRPT